MSYIQQFFTSRDNNANAQTFVGQEGRLWWDPATNQIYSSDGSTPGGIPLAGGGGGNGTPGGLNGQVQFNQAGNFGGSANLAFNSTTGALTAVSFVGNGTGLTSLTGANVVGEVAYAAVANSVAGANVSGTVANATYALSANSASSLVNGASVVLLNSDGTMVFPSNIINSNTNPITLWSTNSSKLLWRDSAGGAPGQPVQTTITAGNGTATITVSTGVLAVQSAKTWTFDTAGNVTFPDATVQTTAYPGTATSLLVTGNITGGNLNAAGLSLSGNVVSAINTTANITTTANIAGGNIIGTHVGNITGTTASLSGNVTGGNILTGGLISATGNITTANLISSTRIFAANGTLTAPSYGFSSDTDTGLFLLADGNLAVTTNAGTRAIVSDTGLAVTGVVSATGNITGDNLRTAGLITATGNILGGNVTTTGAVYSNYNTNTANTGSFMAQGGNTKGGTGYLDFLVAQNTSGGATSPYKWFRTTSDGQLQIINSAYTTNIFNLTDAGAFSVPGPISVSGKQAVNGPAFSAYAAAILQNIPNGVQTKVLFQTEEFDTNNNYASSRFTPTVEGYYQLNAEVRLDGVSGTGEMMIVLYKNGSEYKRGWNQSGTQIATNFWAMTVSSVAYANGSTDYFEIYVQQGSGGTISVTAVNAPAITWFNGCMLRGA